jgi:hypothetical protein
MNRFAKARLIVVSIAVLMIIMCCEGKATGKSNSDVEKLLNAKMAAVNSIIAESTAKKLEHKAKLENLHNTLAAHVEAQNNVLSVKKTVLTGGASKSSNLASSGVVESTSKMQNTLRIHGVNDELIKEINNMASSLIPRETIIKHVQTHFPDKRQHEWNDIVIAAIGLMDSSQPKAKNMVKANKDAALRQAREFEESKKALEAKKEQL